MLPYFEPENFPPLMISFSSFLQNWFHAARWTFWGEAFFWNFFGLISKVLGTYGQPFVLLSKTQSRWFKLQPTCPEKYSSENCFWKNKFRKSSSVKKFKFWPELRRACQNSIQHNQKTNYWKKKSFFARVFLYICFQAWRVKFRDFGAKSGHIVKACTDEQSEKNVFVDKKAGKTGHRATISRSFVEKCRRCCQICNLNVQSSFFRYCFFCKNLIFFKSFCTWSGKIALSWQFFSAPSPKIRF